MKNTKEITTGAMLLAIFGVALLLNRYLSYLFGAIVPLAESVVIIIYGSKYGLKNGLIFSIAVLLITFVLTPEPREIYFILVGGISANLFNYLLSKKSNSFTLVLSIIIVFAIGEILDILVLSSIFYKESFYQIITGSINSFYESLQYLKSRLLSGQTNAEMISFLEAIDVAAASILNEQTVGVLLIISCIITGILEGLIIYIVCGVLFKRFNINVEIGFNQILNLKPAAAYILFGISCLILINRFYFHPVISAIITGVSLFSMFVLAYYGYIYMLVLFRIRLNKKNPILLILLIIILLPTSILALFIIGFLYGAGPPKKYLVVERSNNE